MSQLSPCEIAVALLVEDAGRCVPSGGFTERVTASLRGLFASGRDAKRPVLELLKLAHVLEVEHASVDAARTIVGIVLSIPEARALLDHSVAQTRARKFRERFVVPRSPTPRGAEAAAKMDPALAAEVNSRRDRARLTQTRPAAER